MQPFVNKGCIFIYTFYIGKKIVYFRAKIKFFRNFSLKINLEKYFIFILLLDAQIAFGNLVRRMVEDIHEKGRGRPVFPGVVTEGFS